MPKNLNQILILAVVFLASVGLWLALFFGPPAGLFPSFGFLKRYEEWGKSQKDSISAKASQEELAAMSSFLKETAEDKKDFEKYFIKGEEGRLALLTGIEEAGRQLGATTTISSVSEKAPAEPKKKSSPKSSRTNGSLGKNLAQAALAEAKKSPTSFFDITVTARGPFEAVYKFAHALEVLPFILTVNQSNIRLLSDGGKSREVLWEGAFQITVQSFTEKTI